MTQEERNLVEFKVDFINPTTGENFSIARIDYESMPCALKACEFNDEQMEDLATAIALELKVYNFDTNSPYYEEDVEDAFWKEMEECAVRKGMKYYEDEE